jgi:hypothetical protein
MMLRRCFLLIAFAAMSQARVFDLRFESQHDLDIMGYWLSDYPVGREGFYEVAMGVRDLPIGRGRGLMFQFNNHSDDIDSHLQFELSSYNHGIKASTTYEVQIEAEIATNAPSNVMGVGGAPGDGVVFRLVSGSAAPRLVMDEASYLRQTWPDEVMIEDIGNLANGRDPKPDGTSDYVWKTIRGKIPVRSDAEGMLRFELATHSGFEGFTRFFYRRVRLDLKE